MSLPQREWPCPSCRLKNSLAVPICRCGRARPADQSGWPQIFTNMVFHFNGVIPRTLKHPSHSIEWRMAEAHGARVTADFPGSAAERVTHLIYRPGYERSEKVRAALIKHNVKCMPIAWALDSMLQSRELFENLYKLNQVPAQALPTSAGVMLAHYQHPFYVGNSDSFSIPGFDGGGPESAALLKNKKEGGSGGSGDPAGFPKLQAVPEVVPRVAASYYPTKEGNPVLFHDCSFFFTFPATQGDNREEAIVRHGGSFESSTLDGVNYVVYHPDDKKGELMQQAVVHYDQQLAAGQQPPALVTVSWLLDCFFLDEIVPPTGLYVPSEKLMNTLRKKAAKRASKE